MPFSNRFRESSPEKSERKRARMARDVCRVVALAAGANGTHLAKRTLD